MKTLIGKYVIVRSHNAGVFFGILQDKKGTELLLKNARKLYYWSGANTVEDIAKKGVKNPDNCKFTTTIDIICISTYDQLLPCTDISINSINLVPIWTV